MRKSLLLFALLAPVGLSAAEPARPNIVFIYSDDHSEAAISSYGSKNKAFAEAKLSGDALTSWNYQRFMKDYLRCVDAVDDSVGRITGFLRDNGLEDNTIVIYSSDQGFFLGEHGWYDKRWIYDLEKDPDEMVNQIANPEYSGIKAGLKKRLRELRNEFGDETGKAF